MQKIKKRDEIEKKYQWDLKKIYANEDQIEKDIQKVKELAKKVKTFENHLLDSSKTLEEALNLNFLTIRTLDKLVVYANMKLHEDLSKSKEQILVGRIDQLADEVSEQTAFFTPELLKADEKTIKQKIAENKNLEVYRYTLMDIYRDKEHVLSTHEEEILARLGEVFAASSNTYDMLSDVDLKFADIKNEEGKEVPLNESNYSTYIKSKDRRVRKNAFESLFTSYESLKNTFAGTLKGNMKANCFIKDQRKYSSCLQMELFSDNIPEKLYDTLIQKVSSRLDVVSDYLALRKEILNVPELHMYDLYTPLVENKKTYTYEEAKELVRNALQPLGNQYLKDLDYLFDHQVIDVYHTENKRSGAYSWGCYDSLSYVLLNFEGTFNDVSTLAHELGHAMHSFYSHKTQEYPNASYTIFLAEIASTVNEMLLNRYCYYNATKKEEKLYYLNNLLELLRTTLIRQTMFAEFEKIMYEKCEQEEVLTEEEFSSTYYELNKKYYGKNVVHDDLIRYEWARISHFYNSFYVYKYATGISVAAKIANSILKNQENALENYLTFLKSGGKDDSLNILKEVGIDIVSDDTIDEALNMLEETLEEFKKVYNE